MEYLDELDDLAIQALAELGGGDDELCLRPATNTAANKPPPLSTRPKRRRRIEATYLLRLEHPLSTPQDLANALALTRVPQIETGSGENGDTTFCRLSQSEIDILDLWTAEHCPRRNFTKIRIAMAHKDSGELPTLGRDPTLPHHRPSTDEQHIGSEEEWPVYYFFYGTLADSVRLARLFGVELSRVSCLEAATLLDGRLQTWGGKYRALVDAPGEEVEGHVCCIMSADQEDALRVYEGDSYEVVRAWAVLRGEEVMVRTFRFAGLEDDLTG